MTEPLIRQFPPIGLTEAPMLGWDFAPQLTTTGATLASGPSITVAVASESLVTDPSPGTLLTGAAAIDGTTVKQQKSASGGVAGVVYSLLVRVTTSDGQILEGRDDAGQIPRLHVVA